MINDKLESSMNYQNYISPIYTKVTFIYLFHKMRLPQPSFSKMLFKLSINRPFHKLDQAELLLKWSFVSGVYVSDMHKAKLYISAYTLSQKRGFTDSPS